MIVIKTMTIMDILRKFILNYDRKGMRLESDTASRRWDKQKDKTKHKRVNDGIWWFDGTFISSP